VKLFHYVRCLYSMCGILYDILSLLYYFAYVRCLYSMCGIMYDILSLLYYFLFLFLFLCTYQYDACNEQIKEMGS